MAAGRVGKCTHVCDEDGAAWTSIDGITWQRSLVETATVFGSTKCTGSPSLVMCSSALAKGATTTWNSDRPWHGCRTMGGIRGLESPTAAPLSERSHEGPNFMFAAVEFGPDLIVVGSWESNASVWIATIEE